MPANSPDSSLSTTTRWLAVLATTSLELARHDHAARPWIGWAATGTTLGVIVALGMGLRRQAREGARASLIASAATAALVAAPFVTEALLRTWQIAGESPEIVQLVALRNFMLALSACSYRPGALRLCGVLSVFVALGASMYHLH
jgi:hypothetical protein